jgi:hypothetical protein
MSGDSPTFTSSQGFSAFGVAGATKVSIKVARNSNAVPKLDSSTLALAHGASRTYEDGLTDNGQANSASVVTVTIEGLDSPPGLGTTITAEGATCKCMDVTADDAVGELKKWTANYTSDYAA